MGWRPARITKSLGLLPFLLLLTGGFAAFADEPVTIATLVSNSSYFDHHTVVVRGMARQVKVYPPMGPSFSGCAMSYGAYTFALDDGTGLIQVRVNGACVPGVVLPVAQARMVVVEGVFRAMSRGGDLMTLAMPQLEAHSIRELTEEGTSARNHFR